MEKKFVPGAGVATPYPVRTFAEVRGLRKLPDSLIEAHLTLYQGYVKNVNLLSQHIQKAEPGSLEWSEMIRRMGFETAGMRLHELYFDNLTATGPTMPSVVEEALVLGWGSAKHWQEEFQAMGQMRGVGWVILYQDPVGGRLSNRWISLHEEGHPPGWAPILVMDVWEHAYTGMTRTAYVEAFLQNVHWGQVMKRLSP